METGTRAAFRRDTARYFKYIRMKAGISQSEMARQLGMSRSLLSSMETAVRDPDLLEFVEFCEICGVDASDAYTQLMEGAWRQEPKPEGTVKGRRVNNGRNR